MSFRTATRRQPAGHPLPERGGHRPFSSHDLDQWYGRRHYDLDSPFVVRTTFRGFRDGTGANELFTTADFTPYLAVAPDCMGPRIVWWWQNFPGLDNLARDDQGQPMLNWWPFLFY